MKAWTSLLHPTCLPSTTSMALGTMCFQWLLSPLWLQPQSHARLWTSVDLMKASDFKCSLLFWIQSYWSFLSQLVEAKRILLACPANGKNTSQVAVVFVVLFPACGKSSVLLSWAETFPFARFQYHKLQSCLSGWLSIYRCVTIYEHLMFDKNPWYIHGISIYTHRFS